MGCKSYLHPIIDRKDMIPMDFIIKKHSASNRTIRMPDDLCKVMTDIAEQKGISFNQLVVQCCEYALANLKEEKSNK